MVHYSTINWTCFIFQYVFYIPVTLTWWFFHKIKWATMHNRWILAQWYGRLEGSRRILSGHDGRPGTSRRWFWWIRRRETRHVDKVNVSLKQELIYINTLEVNKNVLSVVQSQWNRILNVINIVLLFSLNVYVNFDK